MLLTFRFHDEKRWGSYFTEVPGLKKVKMMTYSYSHRAVAFLDVLGFKNKLNEFEKEAIDYFGTHPGLSDVVSMEGNLINTGQLYYSSMAASVMSN